MTTPAPSRVVKFAVPMAESLNGLFAASLFVAVALTALSIGLVTSVDLLSSALRNRRFAFVVMLNCVAVPLVGYLLSTALPITPDARTGVVICAICAGGPLGLKATQIAKGDLNWSLSLTVVLLTLNVITVPVWSSFLLDTSVTLRFGDLAGVLGVSIVLPVLVGMAIRARVDSVDRSFRFLTLASNCFTALAVALGLLANSEGLAASVSLWLVFVVLAVVFIAGGLAAINRDHGGRRRASILGTLNRATSVALLITGRAFADQVDVFTAAILFGLVQTVVALGLAATWGAVTTRSRAESPATG